MQRFGTDDGTFFLKRLSNVPFTSLKWSSLLLNTVVNSMIPLEQKIARLQAPSPAAMLPNPRISSDLRMLDLLLRSFIRTGTTFFLTSSCVCSDLPAAILFKQPRAKHYKNVASYNHPNPSYMQSKRILQSLPYLQWTMFIGRQPYQEGNQSLLQHSINCFKASYSQIMRNYLHSFQLCVTKESFDNVT
jgi:hypothetical protein